MRIYSQLRTFLHAHRRTCTSLGVSLLLHALLLVLTSISFVQKPESDMGKTISVNLIAPPQTSPQTKSIPAKTSVTTRKKHPPTTTKQPKPIEKHQTAKSENHVGTINITMAPTYHFKTEATVPVQTPQETAAPAAPQQGSRAASAIAAVSNDTNVDTNTSSQPGTNTSPAYMENPAPAYPVLARRRGQEGTVLLRVDVDTKGRPTLVSLQKSSGFPLLDNAAVQAVKRWKFKPAQIAFFAVSSTVDIPITFKLSP